MKHQKPFFLFALPALLISLSAQAHEPEKHMKGAEKPDCEAMKNMDHANMNMEDPVMQAMMKKCMTSMHQNEEKSHEGHADMGKNDESTDGGKPAKHQHKK